MPPKPQKPKTVAERRQEVRDRIEAKRVARAARSRNGVRIITLVLRSPNGARWEVTVDDKGKLTTTQTGPPDELQ